MHLFSIGDVSLLLGVVRLATVSLADVAFDDHLDCYGSMVGRLVALNEGNMRMLSAAYIPRYPIRIYGLSRL